MYDFKYNTMPCNIQANTQTVVTNNLECAHNVIINCVMLTDRGIATVHRNLCHFFYKKLSQL